MKNTDEGYIEHRKIEIPSELASWPEEKRAEFAFTLLMSVSTSTLATITNRLTPLLHRDFLTDLPDEISLHILSFSDFSSIINASQVSKRWKHLCSDQVLWRCLYQKAGWSYNRKLIRSYLDPEAKLPLSPYLASPAINPPANPRFLVEMETQREIDQLAAPFGRSLRLNSPPGESWAGANHSPEIQLSGRLGSTPSSPMMSQFRNSSTNRSSSPRASPLIGGLTRITRTSNGLLSPGLASPLTPSRSGGELLGLNDLFGAHQPSSPSMGSDIASPSLIMTPLTDRMDDIPPTDEEEESSYPDPIPGIGEFQPQDYFHPLFNPNMHMDGSGNPIINWKELYRQRRQLENNWKSGSYTRRYIPGHSEGVYCIQFDELKIVSGSRDDTIKVWDVATSRCLRTYRGHRGSVLCLQYEGDLLVSGSSDSTIIVWELSTGQILRHLSDHQDSVLNLRFDKKHIVSCSKDRTVKIWDTQTGKLLRTLSGHRVAVNAVQFINNRIVSASGDRTIMLWDLETGECLRTFQGHTRGIACLAFDGECIVSGSSDKTIKVWDVKSGACLRTLVGHNELVRTLELGPGGLVVSGSYDYTLKVWDIRTGRLLLNLADGHRSRVFKLQFSPTRIVSCSQDQNILLWDFAHNVDTTFLV